MPAGFIELSRVNLPTPAIVAERGGRSACHGWPCCCCARPICCPASSAATPWRNADLTVLRLHGQRSPKAARAVAGSRPSPACRWPKAAPCRYWLGALCDQALLLPFLDAPAGSPPALSPPWYLRVVLVARLVRLTFHLARTEAAQPVAFAFGGEAQAVDYARATGRWRAAGADGLAGPAATGPRDDARAGAAAWLCRSGALRRLQPRHSDALEFATGGAAWHCQLLAASGAPAVALRTRACWACSVNAARSSYRRRPRASASWLLALPRSTLAATWPAWALQRLGMAGRAGCQHWMQALQLLEPAGCGSCWPAGPAGAVDSVALAPPSCLRRHITVPATAGCWYRWSACVADGRLRSARCCSALPSLGHPGGLRAADTQAAALLSGGGLVLSLLLQHRRRLVFLALSTLSMQTRLARRAKTAANLRQTGTRASRAELRPTARSACLRWSSPRLAWLALVRWRTARHHQHALWKSLALPAGGVALGLAVGHERCWLPPLDYARSNWRRWVGRHQGAACAGAGALPGRSRAEPARSAGSAGMAVRRAGSVEGAARIAGSSNCIVQLQPSFSAGQPHAQGLAGHRPV